MKTVLVTGAFDDIRSQVVRFLEEAAKLGPLYVLLWSDETIGQKEGKEPKFPLAERQYLLKAIRFVSQVIVVEEIKNVDEIPQVEGFKPDVWVVHENEDTSRKRSWCASQGVKYRVINSADLMNFPTMNFEKEGAGTRKKVLVTGCYDWFHSGHVRFFEETSQLGDLYVVVGHDENVRLLKGDGHPMFSEKERCYMVGSIRFVKQALISTGHGWMDAEPEIEKIKPDIYAVNEDGDKLDKRAFCESKGLEYVVLNRKPKEGLPRRESTHLRGF